MRDVIIEHDGKTPRISASAYVAPTAVICGDVVIGDDCRVMFGAVIVAESAPVSIAARTVIMETAVLRSWPQFPIEVGSDVMIGAGAKINGASIADNAFIGSAASIFPAAEIGEASVVRANAVVHVNSVLPARRVVPEGWTAIGRPKAEVVPPGQDERLLFSLHGVNFTKALFGQSRAEAGMQQYLDLLESHKGDVIVG